MLLPPDEDVLPLQEGGPLETPALLAVDGGLGRLALAVLHALHLALDHVPLSALLALQRLLHQHLDVAEVVAVGLHERVRDPGRVPVDTLLLRLGRVPFFGFGRGSGGGHRSETEQVPLSYPGEECPGGGGDSIENISVLVLT